ncbi:MAG TPA: helix-turn-helix transcriptional regulator [Telluria sp.]|nr:helix-turn-helix transcriptional regulator [Telluria sp.]
MPHAVTLVDTLKRLLKARGITYAELAQRIDMSEANVKRMFSQKNFTLQRLDEVLVASGIGFDELTNAQEGPALISHLTLQQEREIINDPKLLVVAVSVMNGFSFDAIVREYALDPAELTRYLLKLDRIGFLELLPNNRVKLLISRAFNWLPDGPIQTWFRSEAAADFLSSNFTGQLETMRLVNLMLSSQSVNALLERLKQVATDFAQLHQHEARIPLEEKHAVSLMVAARPWVPQAFLKLRRS